MMNNDLKELIHAFIEHTATWTYQIEKFINLLKSGRVKSVVGLKCNDDFVIPPISVAAIDITFTEVKEFVLHLVLPQQISSP